VETVADIEADSNKSVADIWDMRMQAVRALPMVIDTDRQHQLNQVPVAAEHHANSDAQQDQSVALRVVVDVTKQASAQQHCQHGQHDSLFPSSCWWPVLVVSVTVFYCLSSPRNQTRLRLLRRHHAGCDGANDAMHAVAVVGAHAGGAVRLCFARQWDCTAYVDIWASLHFPEIPFLLDMHVQLASLQTNAFCLDDNCCSCGIV